MQTPLGKCRFLGCQWAVVVSRGWLGPNHKTVKMGLMGKCT